MKLSWIRLTTYQYLNSTTVFGMYKRDLYFPILYVRRAIFCLLRLLHSCWLLNHYFICWSSTNKAKCNWRNEWNYSNDLSTILHLLELIIDKHSNFTKKSRAKKIILWLVHLCVVHFFIWDCSCSLLMAQHSAINMPNQKTTQTRPMMFTIRSGRIYNSRIVKTK